MLTETELTVVVMGLGYIGLPTAAVIARTGARVLGVDVTASVVETVNSGRVHIEEVDLDGLVSGVVARGTLRASMTIEPADVFVIAVPTPFDDDHAPDIGYVLNAATTIAGVLKPGDTIILESTSPVGTTEQVRDLLATLRPDIRVPGRAGEQADIAIAYCPERVLPGTLRSGRNCASRSRTFSVVPTGEVDSRITASPALSTVAIVVAARST